MAIVGGFDIHRKQITFDYLDTVTGQVRRGRIEPACGAGLRSWLEQRFAGRDDVTFAVEGCTGWLFVVQELQRAGITALLAEPAETATLRGSKSKAKTDKTDARHLRALVADGKVPASWIPPAQVCELRALLQLYRDLAQEHTAWAQRIHATLFHQGVPGMAHRLGSAQARAALASGGDIGLSPAAAQAVAVALRQMQALEAALVIITQVRKPGHANGGTRPSLHDWSMPPTPVPIRTGRCPPVLLLRPGRPAHRAGCHRVLFRRQAHPRPPVPSGTADPALGPVRGRAPGIPRQLPRPPLLRRRRRPDRR